MLKHGKLITPNFATIILIILHVVGVVGVLFYDEAFISLTSINLLVCFIVIALLHETNYKLFLLYIILVVVTGFLVELAGVITEKVFGSYFYGNNLGPKLLDVPLIIGVNWLLLSYGSCNMVEHLIGKKAAKTIKVALASLAMVIVDVLIEQLCQRLDFWYWKHNQVPLQNYIAWFILALFFNFVCYKTAILVVNKTAIWLFGLQALFFVLLNLFLS